MSVEFPIDNGAKEDHPERLQKLAGVDPKYYYKAEELKLHEDAINALAAIIASSGLNGVNTINHVESLGNFSYQVSIFNYPINGSLYSAPVTTVTHEVPDDDPRIDLILASATIPCAVFIRKGTAGASYKAPEYDPLTEYLVQPIFIDAEATDGANVDGSQIVTQKIWTDAIEAGWTFLAAGPEVTESNEAPIDGSHSIKAEKGSVAMNFISDTDLNVADFTNLIFDTKLGADILYYYIWFYSSEQQNSISVKAITPSSTSILQNFSDNAGTQTVIVPFADFNFSKGTFNQIKMYAVGDNITYKVDNVKLGIGASNNSVILNNSITLEKLSQEVLNKFQDKYATLTENVLNWADPNGALLRTFTGTPAVVWTESNVPPTGEKKTITVYMTGAISSMAFPTSSTYIVSDSSAVYDGTKMNLYVFEYINGNVHYSNTLFTI